MNQRILYILISVFCLSAGFAKGQAVNDTLKRVKKHIEYLASDKLEGRGTGTKGQDKAAKYIVSQFKKAGLQPLGSDGKNSWFQTFPISVKGFPEKVKPEGKNVIGFLDNRAAKTIFLGAHYDHLGEGHQDGLRDTSARGQIHNGADDNASGTAALMELAYQLGKNNEIEPVNFVFIAFSGEELGLLGSKYYVKNPTHPLEKGLCMFNFDMVGRLDEEKGIILGGYGTSPRWGEWLPTIAIMEGMKFRVDSAGLGPSDHASFYMQKMPVMFFFTGLHTDYHKPGDDADKINYPGELKIIKLVRKVIYMAQQQTEIPYREAGNPHAASTAVSFKVTLGIMPDYTHSGPGVKVEGAMDNRPAKKAGVQAEDIILQMGEFIIGDIQDYMKALGKFSKGQTISLKIKRGEEELKMELTF